jgi:hypothetical protein
MPLSDLLPFKWYLVVTCPNCRTRQALFADPSHGKATIRRTYSHQCDVCQAVGIYEPEHIERYQHVVER